MGVYFASGKISSKGIGSTPTNPPTSGTPWDGYKSKAGLNYVKAHFSNKSTWRSSLKVTIGEVPKVDVRTSFKQKGGKWPGEDVVVELYLSEDQDYGNSDDIYLGDKGRDFPSNSKTKRSVYFKKVNISEYITKTGTYYLFIVTYYDGGVNSSTEGGKTERVKIQVSAPVIVTPEPIVEVRTARHCHKTQPAVRPQDFSTYQNTFVRKCVIITGR